MEEDLEAINNISAEVDNAQIQVLAATQCIKAQTFVVAKLKKEAERCKETYESIQSANKKLQSEIAQAEQEINSLQMSKERIRMANVEIKKELLLAKERKLEIFERVRMGEERYEKIWLECKKQYESLPRVIKLQEIADREKSLRQHITDLDIETKTLVEEIKKKKEMNRNIDRERIIKFAEFMVNERPTLIQKAKETYKEIQVFVNKNQNIDIEVAEDIEIVEEAAVTTDNQNNSSDEIASIMPKLQLDSLDFDDISVKLEQVKSKKLDYTASMEHKKSFSTSYFDIGTSVFNRKKDVDDSISSYFPLPKAKNDNKNYSQKKLINILEDVKLDTEDAIDLISKVNPYSMQTVKYISASGKDESGAVKKKDLHLNEPTHDEIIEEVSRGTQDVSPDSENIVNPPSQFLDKSLGSQKTQKSQDHKKIVSFNMSNISQSHTDIVNTNNTKDHDNQVNEPKETINSQLNKSNEDDGFTKMKNMVLKKHNLDLTPPFVYAKNTIQKNFDSNVVTSKFFKINNITETDDIMDSKDAKETKVIDESETTDKVRSEFGHKSSDNSRILKNISGVVQVDKANDEYDVIIPSPKRQKIDESKPGKSFSGYLFSHGPQGLPNSLDISLSTTEYEDGEVDFSHGIDSSLLLSPKADLPRCDNMEVQSQDAPNFLSGLRKTGLSFFGNSSGDNQQDSSASNQTTGGFNFNFGGEEKKNRGGLFSMFQ